MEVDLPDTPANASAADDFARVLIEQRQRMQQFVAAQQQRLDQLAADLAASLREQHQTLGQQHEELDRREAALDEARADLGQDPVAPAAAGEETHAASRSPTSGPAAGRNSVMAVGSTWEQEKQRILAALEAEGTPTEPARVAERIRIEEVLHSTVAALAEKDRELEQVRQSLAAAGTDPGGTAGRQKTLDNDTMIREEREKLRQLQAHWEEMLRSAEVELSVERAKIARERAEMEERLRASNAVVPAAVPDGSVAKSSRGRWLARLGLTDDDSRAG